MAENPKKRLLLQNRKCFYVIRPAYPVWATPRNAGIEKDNAMIELLHTLCCTCMTAMGTTP